MRKVGLILVAILVLGATFFSIGATAKSAAYVSSSDVKAALTSLKLIEENQQLAKSSTGLDIMPALFSQPQQDKLQIGAMINHDAIAYPSEEGFAQAVQQLSSAAVRMITVIGNKSAPQDYRYTLSSSQHEVVRVNADGTATVITRDGKVAANIQAPWAFDANRKAVPTWYSTDGKALVQHVSHQAIDIEYPVTADPSISYGRSVYLRYSKSEVKGVSQRNLLNGVSTLVGVACIKLPKWALTGCMVTAPMVYYPIERTFDAAAAENKCVEIRFDYSGGLDGWKRYSC